MNFTHSATGTVHLAASLASLLLGLGVLLLRKGTRTHRRIGYGYVAAMVALNVTALLIYWRTGRFGPFHAGAVFSLATVIGGFVPALRRRPRDAWLVLHYYFMTWSYVGLLAAAAAEVTTRLLQASFWGAVAASSAAITVIGGVVISRSSARFLGSRRSSRKAGSDIQD